MIVTEFDVGVVAVAPFVPATVARNTDAPAVNPVSVNVTTPAVTVTLLGMISEPHVEPASVDCCAV